MKTNSREFMIAPEDLSYQELHLQFEIATRKAEMIKSQIVNNISDAITLELAQSENQTEINTIVQAILKLAKPTL